MNKRMISAFVAAGLAAMTLVAPAFAEDDAHEARIAKHVDDVFAKLDADKDGKISKAEASKGPRLSRKFDAVDADHDGFVTRAELTAAFVRHAHAKKAAPAAPGQPG